MRQKSVQLPVLKSTKRKIAFPQNIPVYHESQEVTEDITPDLSGSTAESSAADAKFHAAAGEGPAVEEKSGKFYQAGLQAQYKGDGRIAEIYYKKALEELPHHMDAMINLSALYVQQGRYAEAERILAEIIAIEPANSKALVNMGMVSLYQDNEALAATQFEAALAANPREENALVNLAYLAEKNRDYPATEGYYRQLMQIAPENLEVLLAYGHLLEEQRRYSEAMALYADSLALGPVKKDRQLYNKISDRIRLLAGALKNSQP
jgi:Tfp pilus assembly protein PilF